MKKSVLDKSRAMEAGSEIPIIGDWKAFIRNQYIQTQGNTNRIEQLETRNTDIEEQLKQIFVYLQSSGWTTLKPLRQAYLPWSELEGTRDVIIESEEFGNLWLVESVHRQLTIPYQEELSKIANLFCELEKDFNDILNRIVRCELLEKELADFENSLEGDETEYLAWCVSLIRDVLDYNNAEDFTGTHLGLLKKAIKLISEKGSNCNKEDYKNLHKEFLEAEIGLIPTTQKAIEKYGQ
ncbi:MAG: hypothetical protein ABSE89_06790 [Sedimentisphaerales bacterium]